MRIIIGILLLVGFVWEIIAERRWRKWVRETLMDMRCTTECTHCAVHDAIGAAVIISRLPEEVIEKAHEDKIISDELYEEVRKDGDVSA